MKPDLEQLVAPVYRFALRLTRGDIHAAEDITQEAMLKGLQSAERRRLPPGDEARVWLFTVLANVWRDRLRRERIRRATPLDVAPDVATAIRDAGLGDVARQALEHLDALPDRQREVLYLAVCAGLTHGQIATVLGISPGAAKASFSLARQRLHDVVTKGDACLTATNAPTT